LSTSARLQEKNAKHAPNNSEKMYKWRFKSWGLHKNLNSKNATQIVHHAFGGKAVILPIIRGRQVGPKKLKDYLYKIAVNWDGSAASIPTTTATTQHCSHAASASSSFIPRSLGSGDPGRQWENNGLVEVLLCVENRMHTEGYGIAQMSQYDWDGDFRLDFWSDLQQAVKGLAATKEKHGEEEDRRVDHNARNFHLLDRAFGHYAAALESAWPALVWVSIHAVRELARAGPPALAESFVRYAASLCSIKLGAHHAVTRLWVLISSMTLSQFWRVAIPLLNALFTALQTGVPREEELVRTAVLRAARGLDRVGALPFGRAAEAFQSIVDEFRGTEHADDWNRHEWYLWTRWWHAQVMFEAGRLDMATTGLAALGPMIHGGYADFALDRIVAERAPVTMYYTLRGKLHERLGETELATSYYIGAYTFAKVKLGWNAKERLMGTSLELKEHYLRIGDVESANRTECEARAYWEALAGGVSPVEETKVESVDEI
jgi:hypothetical protein